MAAKPETDEERAVATVKRLGGQIQRDENAPGKPVVAVILRSTKVTDASLVTREALTPPEQLERVLSRRSPRRETR